MDSPRFYAWSHVMRWIMRAEGDQAGKGGKSHEWHARDDARGFSITVYPPGDARAMKAASIDCEAMCEGLARDKALYDDWDYFNFPQLEMQSLDKGNKSDKSD